MLLRWYATKILSLNLVWIDFPQTPLQSMFYSTHIKQHVWTMFSLCDLHSWKLLCMNVKSPARCIEIWCWCSRKKSNFNQATLRLDTQIHLGLRTSTRHTQCENRDPPSLQSLKIFTQHPGSVGHVFCLMQACGILEAHKAFLLISK